MKTLTAEERVTQEQASLEVLAKNSQSDHHFNHEGLELLIPKDVFSPHYFNGWRTFTPALLQQIKPRQSLLEVGSGSGITALMAAKVGAEVSTCDINPIAVANTQYNADHNSIDLKHNLLSNVYDGFKQQHKFDIIYWNAPWMEILGHEKIEHILEYGLFDEGFQCLERFISQSHAYLKPNGRLYIGHADFGDYQRLETLLEKYGYNHRVIANEQSQEIRPVEFYLHEAKLTKKHNQIFIAMPFSGRKYEEIVTIRKAYHHLVKQYDLELLEQFIGIEEKEKFENVEYEPAFIVNKDFKLLDQSQLLLVDLQQISVGACFEMAYAKNTCSIPVIGFDCTDVLTQKHPWYAYYCNQIYPTLEEALTYAHDYCYTP